MDNPDNHPAQQVLSPGSIKEEVPTGIPHVTADSSIVQKQGVHGEPTEGTSPEHNIPLPHSYHNQSPPTQQTGEVLVDIGKSLKDPGGALEEPAEALEDPVRALEGPGEALEDPGETLKKPGENPQDPGEDLQGPGEDLQDPGEETNLLNFDSDDDTTGVSNEGNRVCTYLTV